MMDIHQDGVHTTLETLPPLPDIDEVEAFSEKDHACINAIREILRQHEALGRFGLTLLHSHFNVTNDEVLVETVDTETRTLVTRPVKADDKTIGNSIETSWRLDSPTGLARCETRCNKTWGPNGPHIRQHFTIG
jgi:hypothetical protein